VAVHDEVGEPLDDVGALRNRPVGPRGLCSAGAVDCGRDVLFGASGDGFDRVVCDRRADVEGGPVPDRRDASGECFEAGRWNTGLCEYCWRGAGKHERVGCLFAGWLFI